MNLWDWTIKFGGDIFANIYITVSSSVIKYDLDDKK